VLDAVSKPYLEEWHHKKAKAEAEYEKYRSKMVSFFGNDLLTNAYPHIEPDYAPHGSYKTYAKFDPETFKEDIKRAKGGLALADKIVLLLDDTVQLSPEELRQIAQLCGERKLYLVTPGRTSRIAPDGSLTNTRPWKPDHGKMFLADKIHLTPEANEALRLALLSLELTLEE